MAKKGKQVRRRNLRYILISLVVLVMALVTWLGFGRQTITKPSQPQRSQTSQVVSKTYSPSPEEKTYLQQRFADLSAINPEVIGYLYAPGTNIDEPIVQTSDNSTYLDKTFEGNNEPYMGAVFMDTDNNKNLTDELTWLFGHARGSKVPDSRMFNDLNFYENQDYFNQNRYVVVETSERKYYYEAMFFIIVPETTAFYRTSFDSKEQFVQQLNAVSQEAVVKKEGAVIKATDHYLVLSTCREEDDTMRANLYLRQIPDSEMEDFIAENGDKLGYVPTR